MYLYILLLLPTIIFGLTGENIKTGIEFNINSPRILIKEQKWKISYNVIVTEPIDTYGCDLEKLKESPKNSFWLVKEGKCSIHDKIKMSNKAGAAGLIYISDSNEAAGYNAKFGAMDITNVEIPVVEVNNKDGTFLINQQENIIVNIAYNDTNIWQEYYNSGGFVVWQISLSLLFLGTLALSITKLILIGQIYRQGSLLLISLFIVICTLISSMFCLLYVAVDPFYSRGIYTKSFQHILTTIPLPPMILETFIFTYSLKITMSTDKIIKDKNIILNKIIKIFTVVAILIFLIDICFSLMRGSYMIDFNYSSYITTVFYILVAISLILFYLYLHIKISTQLGQNKIEVSKKLSFNELIRMYIKKNLWIFSFIYSLWIVMAISMITILKTGSSPEGKAAVFWFYYLVIFIINMHHLLSVRIKLNKSPTSSQISSI